MSDDNDTVPRYMYDQVQVAYQKQRERTKKLRKERDELRAALKQQEQEPVAWRYSLDAQARWHYSDADPRMSLRGTPAIIVAAIQPLYATPPRREWQSLTEGEIDMIYAQPQTHKGQYARAIEAALKERNHD